MSISEPHPSNNARGAGRRAFVSSYLALALAVVLGGVFAYINGRVGLAGILILILAYVVYLLGFLIPWVAQGFTYREHPGGAAMGLLIGLVFVPAVLGAAVSLGLAARVGTELSNLASSATAAATDSAASSNASTPDASPKPSTTAAPGPTASDSYPTDGTQVCGQDLSTAEYTQCQEDWEYGAEEDAVIDENEADVIVNQFGGSCDADATIPGSYTCEIGDITLTGGTGD